MKTVLTTGWNFMRVIRLVMGVAAIIFGIYRQDMLLGLAGGFLLLMSLLNAGCCGVSGCAVRPPNQKSKTPGKGDEPISYEEVV